MSSTLQKELFSTSKRSGGTNGPSMLHLKGSTPDEHEELLLSHKDLPQTYFPCLDSRSGSNTTWQAAEVPFKDIIGLRSFCKELDVSHLSVFQAAWALVLRCYLGNPSVCFAYSSSLNPEETNKVSRSHPSTRVCHVEFEKTTSLLDVLKETFKKSVQALCQPSKIQSSRYQQPIGPVNLPTNTVLVYREENQRDWSRVVRPLVQNGAGNGLNNV